MSGEGFPSDDHEALPPMELPERELLKTDQYQSLFLTNGQVYFGKLWIYETAYVLTDIYYLQDLPEKDENNRPKQQLIKLGNENHGPEDMQVHPRATVQFWQNLREDGNVSQSIADYRNEQGLD